MSKELLYRPEVTVEYRDNPATDHITGSYLYRSYTLNGKTMHAGSVAHDHFDKKTIPISLVRAMIAMALRSALNNPPTKPRIK